MATSALMHRFPTALVLGLLAAMARAGSAGAEQSPSTMDTFQSIEAISYEVESKRAVGYFERVDGKCNVTLLIAEVVDLDQAPPTSAARLNLPRTPGQSAAVESEEREAMVFTCGTGAWTVEVKRTSAARS